jgi:hypothetical protein
MGLSTPKSGEKMPFESGMRISTAHRINERWGDKNRTRFMAEGNRSVVGAHFGAVSTSMPTDTAIKLVVSFAAGLNQGLFAIEFTRAFLNAPVGNPDLYVELLV